MSKLRIGIFGSCAGDFSLVEDKARQLGIIFGLHRSSLVLVTGASSGLPYTVAAEAAIRGVEVWGYSPYSDLASHKAATPADDMSIYAQLVFLPKQLLPYDSLVARRKFRNVISTMSCDGAVFISGRWGTLNEFTNIVDLGKVACVFTGTGGVADFLYQLWTAIKKENQGKVLFHDSPELVVSELLTSL